MKKIIGNIRKALREYNMIEDGDKIAVGVSGGKDSLTLLMALKNLQMYYDKTFDFIAVSINPNFDFFDINLIENFCNSLSIPLIIENSHSKEIVFDIRSEKNPCSLCANLRRGILNSIAIRENCNKIALGHNEDDVIETFILSLFYNGNVHTFAPKSYMDRSKITVIRPLIYLSEKDIKSFINRNKIAVMNKCCPMDGNSKRENIKEMINDLQKSIPNIKSNLYGAIKRSNIQGW